METVSERSFTKQLQQFLQANDKIYEGMKLPSKNIRSSTEQGDYQVSTWVNDIG